MNFTKYSKHFLLAFLTIISSLIFWSLFTFNIPQLLGFGHVSLETIFANYDGPNYMVVAKCGYDKNCIGTNFSLPQPLEYYPAHLPGFPLLIHLFNLVLSGPKAMLLSTLLGSVLLSLVSFEFFKLYVKQKTAFWLSLILLIFPARLFVLHQIGAPETWFISLTLLSLLFFTKKNYLLAAVTAALAQIFKSPGVILLLAYFILAIIELFKTKDFISVFKKYIYFLLVPFTLYLVFLFYKQQTGDFFAYFHSGDNFHLTTLPYSVFISTKSWINTIWLEDIIYIFALSFYGVYKLFKKYSLKIITLYPLLFILATVLVAHRDISRYIAPVYPFIILAFAKTLDRKPVKILMLLLLPAIVLYAINFIVGNTAPVADWAPYL